MAIEWLADHILWDMLDKEVRILMNFIKTDNTQSEVFRIQRDKCRTIAECLFAILPTERTLIDSVDSIVEIGMERYEQRASNQPVDEPPVFVIQISAFDKRVGRGVIKPSHIDSVGQALPARTLSNEMTIEQYAGIKRGIDAGMSDSVLAAALTMKQVFITRVRKGEPYEGR